MYSTPVGEALLTDYCLHELPTETVSSCDDGDNNTSVVDGACSSTSVTAPAEETQGLVHAALTARIEFLEAQNKSLTQQLALPKQDFHPMKFCCFSMSFLGQLYTNCSTGVVRQLQNITKRNWIHLISFFLL